MGDLVRGFAVLENGFGGDWMTRVEAKPYHWDSRRGLTEVQICPERAEIPT